MWLRNGLVAVVMLVLCFTFATAEVIKGKVTKIDEKSVTITNKKSFKDGKAFDLAKGVKFFKEVTKDDKTEKEEIKDGLKAEVFAKLSDKGVNATITTNDDGKVTEIVVTPG